MENEIQDPPYLRNVGIMVTYHCQAACAHCIIRAGPDRHEQVKVDEARDWIRQIAAYRNHFVIVLSLTGGEPFSNLALLRQLLECAVDCGLRVSIVSNGFWATSREKAKELLQSLPGICFLSVSTDLYHQQYIPFERVKNAIRATQDCGIPSYVSVFTGDKSDPQHQKIVAELRQIVEEKTIRIGTTFPVGRAARMNAPLNYSLSEEPPNAACQAASSPCIFPDGRVYGCIGPLIDLQHGHPLILGNARESSLAEIFDRSETNVVLHALRIWGPGKLVSLLREAGLEKCLPAKYVSDSICNTCYDLMTNPTVRNWLHELEQDAAFRRKVAYGRLFYLNESGTLEFGGYKNELSPTVSG